MPKLGSSSLQARAAQRAPNAPVAMIVCSCLAWSSLEAVVRSSRSCAPSLDLGLGHEQPDEGLSGAGLLNG